MNLPAVARIPLMLLLVSACSTVPVAQPASSTPPLPSGAALASASPTVKPTLEPPPATGTLPPRGFLTGDEGPVQGWLGSYCWHGTCADAPGPPAADALPIVIADPSLEFSIADDASFNRWRATYRMEDVFEETLLGEGGENFDPDAQASPLATFSAVSVPAPPRDSVVHVQVFFPDGDLSYYWHVFVAELPPAAELRLPDGPTVEGQLGSWCYYDGCADSPAPLKSALPALDIRRRAGLTFGFAEGDQFAYVEVQYSAESDFTPVVDLASGGTYVDPDTNATQGPLLSEFSFDGPPSGDWVLEIQVRFPGEVGDAPYYWHAMVE
jgi:hypothetical protein